MTDDAFPAPPPPAPANNADGRSLSSSSLYRLCEELISLREMNSRQHQMFTKALNQTRDDLRGSFNSFAADTQRAYQQLRQETQGDKKFAMGLLNDLLELNMEMSLIVGARPKPEDSAAVAKWMEAIEVQSRKMDAMVKRHGIHPFNAVVGSAYNPALHERVGSRPVEGMDPSRVAEQTETGYASQMPDFVLRRPKVIVSE
jgi:molecular chaperone GrpE (heat shock protein)